MIKDVHSFEIIIIWYGLVPSQQAREHSSAHDKFNINTQLFSANLLWWDKIRKQNVVLSAIKSLDRDNIDIDVMYVQKTEKDRAIFLYSLSHNITYHSQHMNIIRIQSKMEKKILDTRIVLTVLTYTMLFFNSLNSLWSSLHFPSSSVCCAALQSNFSRAFCTFVRARQCRLYDFSNSELADVFAVYAVVRKVFLD